MGRFMKLAIVGSRGFEDYDKFKEILDILIKTNPITAIVSGGAEGADLMARFYAQENNIELIEFIPEWNKHGKGAGFIRNVTIWDNANFGIAFWDGISKGTAHSFQIVKKQKKKLYTYNYIEDNFYIN